MGEYKTWAKKLKQKQIPQQGEAQIGKGCSQDKAPKQGRKVQGKLIQSPEKEAIRRRDTKKKI